MIAVIRIRGRVGVKKPIEETLERLRLRRKYSCIVITNPDKNILGMIKKVKDLVAFGEINKETFKKLIEKRGKLINKNKRIDKEKVVGELAKGKKYEEVNLKPFFRLSPPRGGIRSKGHFNEKGPKKGVLGDNKKNINKLIERML